MSKKGRFSIFLALLLIVLSSTVSHAAISKPKNFRIVFMSDKGVVLESFEWSVYAVQQVFLDKLNTRIYIDPKGYEYSVSAYRLKTWTGANYTGTASEDLTSSYSGIVSALRKAYDSLDSPYSLQATLVMKATGNKYSIDIPIHVIWLNQNNEFVKEEIQYLGRNGAYTDKPPKEYEILGVDAMMTDIWNVGSEITIDKNAPTVRYSKFAKEYRIVYRLNLTPEEESDIVSLPQDPSEEESGSSGTESMSSSPVASAEAESGESSPAETEQTQEYTPEHISTDPGITETVSVPTQTDESFRSGSGKITLIIGLVIGIAVIYLIVIAIGKDSRKKPKRRIKL